MHQVITLKKQQSRNIMAGVRKNIIDIQYQTDTSLSFIYSKTQLNQFTPNHLRKVK